MWFSNQHAKDEIIVLQLPSNGVARSIDFTHHNSLVGIPVATTRGPRNEQWWREVSLHQQFMRDCAILTSLLIWKRVTFQGRTDQKLDWHFDLRNTTTLTQSSKGQRTGVCFSYSFRNRMAWRTTRVICIDERLHAYSWLSIDRRGSEDN